MKLIQKLKNCYFFFSTEDALQQFAPRAQILGYGLQKHSICHLYIDTYMDFVT
jgi:hypothetical protein